MKKTILFDVSVLLQGISNSGTGIYYTALNLLDQFVKSDQFDISLYAPTDQRVVLQEFLQHKFDRDFVFYPPLFPVEKTIFSLKQKAKKLREQHKNVQKFFVYLVFKILRKFIVPKFVQQKFDIYFSPMEKPIDGIQANKKYVVLYDTIPLCIAEYSKGNVEGWFADLKASLNGRDFYFAISESAKKDFLRFCPKIKPNQITTTLLATSNNFYQEKNADKLKLVRKKYNIPENKKYVFSLCTLEPRKNLIRAVKTFIQFIKKNNIDDIVFVLGGGCWDRFIEKLETEISNLGDYKNKIIRAGYVADEDLAPLYSGAEWFVYTSQYEGFGLPPLEAMSCGCPVITSNNSSLPEVVGNAGVMIDYDSDEQHIKAYEDYYFNEELRRSYASKGLERAKQFSWEKTANIMIKEMIK